MSPGATRGTIDRSARVVAVGLALVLIAAACTNEPQALDPDEAEQRLYEMVDEIDWTDNPVGRREAVPPPTEDLTTTLPDIDLFAITAAPRGGPNQTVAEIFTSTEKSGDDTDGWMVEAAESFNASETTLSDGSIAQVAIREIASGTGYQFIAAGEELPEGFSPVLEANGSV